MKTKENKYRLEERKKVDKIDISDTEIKVNEFSCKEIKSVDKKEIRETKTPSLTVFNQQEKLGNIEEKLNLSSSINNRSNKLSSNDGIKIISNEKLSNLQINKKLSGRESYFYFLNYIIKVKIINKTTKNKIKKEEKPKNKTKEEPSLFIDFSEGKTYIKSKNKYKIVEGNINFKEGEKMDKYYEKIIHEENNNIQEYFIMYEEITLEKLEEKMHHFYDDFLHLFICNNNFPHFQSDLFYYYQLKNMFKTFFELNKENFYKKIKMIYILRNLVSQVDKNIIKDSLILNYFYFIMDIDYEINELNISQALINDYDETNRSYKGAQIKENKLIIENSSIIVDNIDCYNLNEKFIEKIKEGIIDLPLSEGYFSLKGKLLFRELSTKDGNIIYDAFLPSKLNQDIIFKLYDIKENIFSSEAIIKLFKENTFYFPINNKKYLAYTNKECFKIFIDYKVGENIFPYYTFNDKIKHLIKKSIMIINIQHEFGHSHKLLLFSCDIEDDNDFFYSSLVKIKINNDNEIELREGGEVFEYLLYGRSIDEINMKEVIYINNLDNFSKTLEEFRNDFNDLKNKTLKDVLINEAGNNNEIIEVLEVYDNLSDEEKSSLENLSFKTRKKYKNLTISDLETIKFKIGKKYPHNKFREENYIISKFTCE